MSYDLDSELVTSPEFFLASGLADSQVLEQAWLALVLALKVLVLAWKVLVS